MPFDPHRPMAQRFTYGPSRKRGPKAAKSIAPPVLIPTSYAHEARLSEGDKIVHVVLCLNLQEAKRSGARWLLTGCKKQAPVQWITLQPFEQANPDTPRCQRCIAKVAARRSTGAVIGAPIDLHLPTSRRRAKFRRDAGSLLGRMERLLTLIDRGEKYGFEAREPSDAFTLVTAQAKSVIVISGKRYVLTLEEEFAGRKLSR